ncbi:MAG: glycine dehydrogenase (aminomethyl-transferring), partial [Acidobacteriota bacterium]
QTMVADLTGLPVANASLLDEATAAAEAMHMAHAMKRGKKPRFFAAADCHPQTLAVLRTRAEARGIELVIAPLDEIDLGDDGLCGLLLQSPNTEGVLVDCADVIEKARERGVLVSVATDLLALTLMTSPGELGADIAVGSAQRFGVPLGFGGPHAAFLATREAFKRQIPGRIIGLSKDSAGHDALRMAMQTREQHIRREKATSNICTAQVLLAVMAGAYAVYHGPDGLRRIAERVRHLTLTLGEGLEDVGHAVDGGPRFDTLVVRPEGGAPAALGRAAEAGYDLRPIDDERLGISLDETVTAADLAALLRAFGDADATEATVLERSADLDVSLPAPFARSSSYLEHPVFHAHHTEHEMLRYLHRLESRDLSLTTSMIPLGSCTMKLNATSEMIPVSWPELSNQHPFAPPERVRGYHEMFRTLESWLGEITGFDAVSLQPNAGAQGEYTGLLTIRAFHRAMGNHDRDVCLIP